MSSSTYTYTLFMSYNITDRCSRVYFCTFGRDYVTQSDIFKYKKQDNIKKFVNCICSLHQHEASL